MKHWFRVQGSAHGLAHLVRPSGTASESRTDGAAGAPAAFASTTPRPARVNSYCAEIPPDGPIGLVARDAGGVKPLHFLTFAPKPSRRGERLSSQQR